MRVTRREVLAALDGPALRVTAATGVEHVVIADRVVGLRRLHLGRRADALSA